MSRLLLEAAEDGVDECVGREDLELERVEVVAAKISERDDGRGFKFSVVVELADFEEGAMGVGDVENESFVSEESRWRRGLEGLL